MAKTNRRPVDKFERKQRLAQRPQRRDEDFQPMNLHRFERDEDDGDIVEDYSVTSETA